MARRFNFQTGQWESYQSDFDKSISKSKIKPGQAEKPKPTPTPQPNQTEQRNEREHQKELHALIQQGLSEKGARRQLRITGLEPALEQKKERERLDIKDKALAEVDVPRAENISETTSNIAGEAGENVFGVVTGTSAASAGDLVLIELKRNKELQQRILGLTNYMIENGLTPEMVTDDPLEQSLLRLKLNENDIKVLNKGKADVSDLAQVIEGLPIFTQITKVTGGAVTPTSAFAKITDLNTKVEKLTSQMDNWSEAITKNPQLATQYESLINEAVQTVIDAQSRIKLMVIQSPILQNAPEEVEVMQVNLDKALTKSIKLQSTVIQTRFMQ